MAWRMAHGGVLALPLLLGVTGCNGVDDRRYPLTIEWSLVDGRTCIDAGVATVTVRTFGATFALAQLSSCTAGLVGAAGASPQLVGAVPAGSRTYQVDALTPAGGAVYRGTFDLDASSAPPLTVVTLYYVGGAPP
jgi:hypothetical protein